METEVLLNSPQDCVSYRQDHRITHGDCKKYCVCDKHWKKTIPPAFEAAFGLTYGSSEAAVVELLKHCADNLIDSYGLLNKDYASRLLDMFIRAYRDYYYEGLEHCLMMKRTVKDCVLGCSSKFVGDSEINPKEHCHPHQNRAYSFTKFTGGFDNMENYISTHLEELNSADSFDELHQNLLDEKQRHKSSYSGFGALSIFDAAQRLYRQSGKWNPANDKKVYLHAGVFGGAGTLWNLSRLFAINWLKPDFDEGEKRDACIPCNIADFDERLQQLRPHHLENFICIFHVPFFLLENALRIRTRKELRLFKNKPKANGKKRRFTIPAEPEEFYNLLKPTDYPAYSEWMKSK